MTKLVIVESPAKARTIASYLGKDFKVEASIGHIRDLPQPSSLPASMRKGPYAKFAVNVDDGFDPYYVISPDKKTKVAELKRLLKDADELYLATDEDREGEAIAWHLHEVLKPKVPVKRMVFHEITKDAISEALNNTRNLDTALVDAQETRRILDRLYGYQVSPLLWRKVGSGLSAGRVQSVATRLVVERERERMAFVPAFYWDIEVQVTPDTAANRFTARVISLGGKRFAVGKDFNDQGKMTRSDAIVMDEELAKALGKALEETPQMTVLSLETKPYKRRPAAPFTTSTLQQEASRKLKMSSRDTMRTAQFLYENGYITYMRTDSTNLSGQAIAAARQQAASLYGADSIPEKPRFYATKSKGAQEAHEAIRPAGSNFRTPKELSGVLDNRQLALYELIWKRTVASQMVDATGHTASVKLGTDVALKDSLPQIDAGTHPVVANAAGTVITNRGFLAAYEEGRDQERYARRDEESLPELKDGQAVTINQVDWEDRQHATTPPPRYTEASLVKDLEEHGIGRPSTYAATIGTIIDRGYVRRKGQALVPTFTAFSVTRLLEENLASLVDYQFTAQMEEDLDKIAAGDIKRNTWLSNFWWGEDGTGKTSGLQHQVESLGDIDARAVNTLKISDDISLRVGKYGPYLEDDAGHRATVPDDVAPDELNPEMAKKLLTTATDEGRKLGKNPQNGNEVVVKNGRYGPYVTEVLPAEDGEKKKAKPPTASLFKTMTPDSVTLEQALMLLSMPREVGVDPADGQTILAQNGRYGPYLTKGKDNRSLESEEQIFSITLDEALALFAQEKTYRRAAKAPLAEFGDDPVSGKKVTIKDGRFGPYITDGTTNVTVPRGRTPQEITEAEAFQMLADKRAKGPSTRGRKSTAKKSTAKKSTAKKTTAKKASTKKTAK